MITYPYTFVHRKGLTLPFIRFKKGPYAGFGFALGKVHPHRGDAGEPLLQFEYEVMENPHNIPIDTDLYNAMGQVIIDLAKAEKALAKVKSEKEKK